MRHLDGGAPEAYRAAIVIQRYALMFPQLGTPDGDVNAERYV
jgi:hypothetical protein